MTARSLHRSLSFPLILWTSIFLAPIGMAQGDADAVPIQNILTKLNSTAHVHLEAWKKVTSTQQIQAAQRVTSQQLKTIDTLIGQLKRLKKPSNKARQQLTEKMEKDLLLLSKHWDRTDLQIAKRKTIQPFYQKASAQLEAHFLEYSPTLSRWTSPNKNKAK